MRQSELCRELSRRTATVGPKDVRRCLESFADILREKTLGEGVEIITPFGKFGRKTFAARKCHNPRTGRTTLSQETRTLAFRTRKGLKLHRQEDGTYAAIPARKRKSTTAK